MRRAFLPVLALAALAACAAPPIPSPQGAVLASFPRMAPSRRLPVADSTGTGEERAYATALLADLQVLSFAENREYCGYIGLDPSGALTHTPPVAGSEASCPLPRVPPTMALVASYHTHGTYSPWYASEWPTSQDMDTDASDGIAGYISTPGGRLWYVDSAIMTVRQVCRRGCLPQDPRYVAADDGPVRTVMTYKDLLAWERGM